MRTTVRLDEELLTQAKRLALQTGRTLTAVIEDSLRLALAMQKQAKERPSVRLPTFGGDGLQPGVDLDDSAGLRDRMDETAGE